MEKSPNAELVCKLFDTFTPGDIRQILDMYEEGRIFRCDRCHELAVFYDRDSEVVIAGEYHQVCDNCADELNEEFFE